MTNPAELEELFGPASREVGFNIRGKDGVKTHFSIKDRIGIDDVTLHLIHRELYRLAGGKDPGNAVTARFKDFLIRERFLERV